MFRQPAGCRRKKRSSLFKKGGDTARMVVKSTVLTPSDVSQWRRRP
jgi:hypothetical protein